LILKTDMKKIFLGLSVMALLMGSCSNKSSEVSTDAIKDNATLANPNGSDEGMPIMTFEKTEHDFGTITDGEIVEVAFRFTNTGDGVLLISDAKGDCGCTVPRYPTEPLNPGDEGVILVSFNSSGKVGENQKKVTVVTNAREATSYLNIKATVLPSK
jgi:hypothetical protein